MSLNFESGGDRTADRHVTTGTERPTSHVVSGFGLAFDPSDEIAALRPDLSRSSGYRSAKTLAKSGSLRLTLIVLEAKATMAPDSIAGARPCKCCIKLGQILWIEA